MLLHAVDAVAAQLVGTRDCSSSDPHHNLPAGHIKGSKTRGIVLLPINQLGSSAHIKEGANKGHCPVTN